MLSAHWYVAALLLVLPADVAVSAAQETLAQVSASYGAYLSSAEVL